MASEGVPTLYDWLGGIDALIKLTGRFYERVKVDSLLAPVFAHMGTEHPQHVAAFLAEVLGGPKAYSEQHGGHAHMIRQHLNRHLDQRLRRRWVALLLETADELKMPDDPEFRSALVGYLEWGSRLAVINSQPDAMVDESAPMPRWGWGEVKGPYRP
jgi:hemoglobin